LSLTGTSHKAGHAPDFLVNVHRAAWTRLDASDVDDVGPLGNYLIQSL